MPELPEVETITRALQRHLRGRVITAVTQRRGDLRWPLPAGLPERLHGRRLEDFTRRAKYIQALLDDGQTLLLHLGMSGRLVLGGEPLGVHEHLTFALDDGSVLRFVDPRRFGMLDLVAGRDLATHRWLAHLGIEPLGNGFSGTALARLFKGRIVPIKQALMDQRLVVGVGNIYASEALFRAGIRPTRPAGSVARPRLDGLADAIRAVLTEAIEAGGSSLRDYVQADGELGHFQENFRVYDRAGLPCPSCGRPIKRLVQGGRATFCCGRCQR